MEKHQGLVRQSLNGGTCSHTDICCPSTDRIAQLTLATTTAAEVTPGETWSEDISRSSNQNFHPIYFFVQVALATTKEHFAVSKEKIVDICISASKLVARNQLLKNENWNK